LIRLERTRDYELVAKIMSHPRIYPWIADDFYPAPENFWPHTGENVFYLLAYEGGELLGLIMTHPINGVLWETHHAVLPHAWGARAAQMGAAFFEWLWHYTEAQTCLGITAADNRLALRFARNVLGMQESGRIRRGIRRGAKLHDLIIFTKERP
jgi:hypothetical protein